MLEMNEKNVSKYFSIENVMPLPVMSRLRHTYYIKYDMQAIMPQEYAYFIGRIYYNTMYYNSHCKGLISWVEKVFSPAHFLF